MLTIAIFTREKNEKLDNLLKDLKKQTIWVKIKLYNDKEQEIEWIENIETKDKNIAEKRNQAIRECTTRYLFLLDDDNRIYDEQFLQKLIKNYQKVQIKEKKSIISPIIMRRDSEIVQSAGIKFCYFLGKVMVNKKIKWDFWETKGMWGNSLFGETKFFQFEKFDEKIGFVSEDIDYIYSLKERWITTFVINQKINHMEKDKTKAEKSFVKDKESLDRKIKNRKIFVKKHAKGMEKVLYRSCGHWVGIIYWNLLKILWK